MNKKIGDKPRKHLLETSVIVIGYAMSRLDTAYLKARGCAGWRRAWEQASAALGVPAANFRNLRDEFDPVHGNARRGWHKRRMFPSRQRVMGELCEVSDNALIELVDRILAKDAQVFEEAVSVLTLPVKTIPNVAERLLTGRRAEEYFLENCHDIISVARAMLEDHRNSARGFDFGVRGRNAIAVEVKGIKQKRGDVLFTDREWTEARARRADYWLVIVGNLEAHPIARAVPDPYSTLKASCRYQTSISATWRASVAVA